MTMKLVVMFECMTCSKETVYNSSIKEARAKYLKAGGTIDYRKRKGSRKVDNFAVCGECNFLATVHPAKIAGEPKCPECQSPADGNAELDTSYGIETYACLTCTTVYAKPTEETKP